MNTTVNNIIHILYYKIMHGRFLTLMVSGSGHWVLITGGCSGRGVQWMGVALHNQLVYNIICITTPCFHCTPFYES